MTFPNEIQTALLFNGSVGELETIVRNFMRVEESRSGAGFNVSEANPGVFYRMFGGGDELMVTIEYLAQPANMEVFQQRLGSTITGVVCPDMRQRLMQCRSHILINVSHGVLGNLVQSLEFLRQIDYPDPGASLPKFKRRLNALALLTRIVCDHAQPNVVHWTQSNQLFSGEAFDALAELAAPSPLHIRPYLFGGAKGGEPKVGIRTFGARHFIGRELLIEPSVLPWADNYNTLLAFLAVATAENGYFIPDGDTFGPEDRSLSYRVIHRKAEPDDVPLYELVPLMYREHGFVADDYVPDERVIDDRAPPADLMPEDDEGKLELANEWREKRAMAEGLGGRFEVRHRQAAPGASPPPRPPFAGRPVFGRKGLN